MKNVSLRQIAESQLLNKHRTKKKKRQARTTSISISGRTRLEYKKTSEYTEIFRGKDRNEWGMHVQSSFDLYYFFSFR